MNEIQIEPETSYMAHELTRDDLIETETTYTMRGLTREDLLRIRDGLDEILDYDDPDLTVILERLNRAIKLVILMPHEESNVCTTPCPDPDTLLEGMHVAADYKDTERVRNGHRKFINECPLRKTRRCKWESRMESWE